MSVPTRRTSPLAVLAQRPQERRRPGRARGGDEHRERPSRQVDPVGGELLEIALAARPRASRASSRPSSRPDRPRSPGGSGAGATRNAPARRSSCGQPARQSWFESERYVAGENQGASMTLIAPSIGARHVPRVGVVPGDDRVEPLVAAARSGSTACSPTRWPELAQPARARARPRASRGCRRPTRVIRKYVAPAPALDSSSRHRGAPRRARGRRRGAGSGRPVAGSPSKKAKR